MFMRRKPQKKGINLGLVALVSVALLSLGGGATWWAYKSFTTSSSGNLPDPQPPSISASPEIIESEPENELLQVYWLNSENQEISLVAASVSKEVNSATSEEALKKTIEILLAGPEQDNYITTIPQQTKLLNLKVEPDGVHVNLSEEFTFGGGSAQMTARLAQIIYTSTVLNPNQPVWIDIEGEPLEVLGGEGLIVNQPMTRADFEQNFSLAEN